MDQDIKKNLTKNWFKILQEIICKDIEEIENRKDIFEIYGHLFPEKTFFSYFLNQL